MEGPLVFQTPLHLALVLCIATCLAATSERSIFAADALPIRQTGDQRVSFDNAFDETNNADPIDLAPLCVSNSKLRGSDTRMRLVSRGRMDAGRSQSPADTDDQDTTFRVEPTNWEQGDDCWHPLDTLMLFGGLEGSKQPQDFGVNANFGSRWAFNWGFPLLQEYGIGAQIGTSINQTDNAVQVFERLSQSTNRTQNFSTIGVFQRINNWRWAIGYDFLYESYYDQFFLGQWRGRGGYAVTEKDEFGVWFAISQHSDSGNFSTIPVTLTPLTQGSAYWQHQFSAGTRTTAWAGVSEGHAQANLALGDLKKTGPQFVFGAEIDVPLNQFFAIYGQANFISPADTGTVDSYLGIAYYPGGHAFPTTRSPFEPLLALANSTMFATNLKR